MTTLRGALPLILGIAAVSVSVFFVAPVASAYATQVPSAHGARSHCLCSPQQSAHIGRQLRAVS